MRHRIFFLSIALTVAACSKGPPTGPDSVPPDDGADTGKTLTAAECEAQGGQVVGDIGDGAIHRPDYVCPGSGEPPLGDIGQEPGGDGPIAVEGAVCCPAVS